MVYAPRVSSGTRADVLIDISSSNENKSIGCEPFLVAAGAVFFAMFDVVVGGLLLTVLVVAGAF
jgi:hypothetical protein